MLQNEIGFTLNKSKDRTLIIESGPSLLDNIFYSKDSSELSLLKIMGKPLILYNIEKLLSLKYDIDHIILPKNYSYVANIIQETFPLIQIDEMKTHIESNLKISTNSVVTKPLGTDRYVLRNIAYPWDILKIMHEVLNAEITDSNISKDSSIAESAIIKGPCIIEDGVSVDDFTKIIGPIYLGRNNKIGTGSLVRHSMHGDDVVIGFNCEIARSFFAGNSTIAHLDIILDSVVGKDCWLGGFVGTTNALLNKEKIQFKLTDKLVSTGLDQFGSVIGYNSAIGAGTIILPGRFVPPNSVLQAGTIFSK